MINLDLKKVKAAIMVLRAVKNPIREQILSVIDKKPGITVTEIFMKLGMEQSVASLHLGALRKAGIVRTEREGKSIHYYIDSRHVRSISKLVNKLAIFYED